MGQFSMEISGHAGSVLSGNQHTIIAQAAEQGLTVLMASSEVPEILALCDRVAVLSKGRLAGILERAEMSEDRILTLAFREH